MVSLAQFQPNTEPPIGVSWWLTLALFVTAVNAPLRRRAAKEAHRSRAGALGAIALLAWVSAPLLDALDVSPPNWRIAAGLALALGAVVDAVGRPVEPLLFRPELALLAVQSGSDHGVWPTILAALLALVSYTFMRKENRALGRGFAIAQLALAILLTLDGVFAV